VDDLASITLSKDPFAVTYHIRPGARWSDGQPVTARDFQFTVLASRRAEWASLFNGWWSTARMEVVDARTFRMQLDKPVGLPEIGINFPGGVHPRHVEAGMDPLSNEDLWKDGIVNPRTGAPIASGPFLFDRWRRGRSITLRRNPNYWGPHTAYLDKLVFRFLPENELADALRRGEIDVIDPDVTTSAATEEIRRSTPAGVEVRSVPSGAWEQIAIRVGPGGHPALRGAQGRLVRRALAYGIDRTKLVRTLEQEAFGRTTPRLEPLQSVVHLPQNPSYEPNWKRYSYRPALARRLLAHAGCRRGSDGVFVCGKERLSLRVGTTAGVDTRLRTLAFVQTELSQIGVEVAPVYYPTADTLEPALVKGDVDLALWTWKAATLPEYIFHSGGGRTVKLLGSNDMGFTSRLVDRELDNADRALNESARAAALNRADRLIAQAVPVIPLYQRPATVAYRSGLKPAPDPRDLLWNVADWWLGTVK
jgi:peptide/nickel transport system substrate-binding protein